MTYFKRVITAAAAVYLSACSSVAEDQQHYVQVQKENSQKVMIVVHSDAAVPDALIQAFNREVPAVAAEQGFVIVDAQARQVTEVPAMTDVDMVLYVEIQRWSEQSSELLASEATVELEYKLVSATSDQTLWHHKEKHTDTRFTVVEKFLPDALYQAFFAASSAYEQQASAVTEEAFSDFPEALAANH
jgi:hypothetical protein